MRRGQRPQHFGRGRTGEGRPSGEHFEHEAAEREDIGRRRERFAGGLLRGRVKRRAFEVAQPFTHLLGGNGQAEIENLRFEVRTDEHVLRLEVPMNQSLGMRHRQPAGHFLEQTRLLREREALAGLVQRITVDQLHDDRGRVRLIEHRENGDDRGVAHAGGAPGFREQAGPQFGSGPGAQDLESHRALKLFILRLVNGAQPAPPEHTTQREAGNLRRRFARRLLAAGGHAAPCGKRCFDPLADFPAQRLFHRGEITVERMCVGMPVEVCRREPGGGRDRNGALSRRDRIDFHRRRALQETAASVMCLEQGVYFAPQRCVGATSFGQDGLPLRAM